MSSPKFTVHFNPNPGTKKQARHVYLTPAAVARMRLCVMQFVCVKHDGGEAVGIVQTLSNNNYGPFEMLITPEFASWANVKQYQKVTIAPYTKPLKVAAVAKISTVGQLPSSVSSEAAVKDLLRELRYIHPGMTIPMSFISNNNLVTPPASPAKRAVNKKTSHPNKTESGSSTSESSAALTIDEVHVESPDTLLEAVSALSLEEVQIFKFDAFSEVDVEFPSPPALQFASPKRNGAATPVGTSQTPQPEAIRVTFDKIGGLQKQIAILRDAVELPLLHPELFEHFHITPPRGILLYGPPGTGKTMILRAVAAETSAQVFTVDGPSIVGKYLGETESRLRKIFEDARANQPSIIFVDEIDALVPKRTGDVSEAESRTVATFLTLLDGMANAGRVAVVAATNRPNSIDEALRRPGRLEKEIEIGIPDKEARLDILKLLFHEVPNSLSDGDIEDLAARSHAYVGADLAAVVREAALRAIKRVIACKQSKVSEEKMDKSVDTDSAVVEDNNSAIPAVTDEKVNMDDVEFALSSVRQSAMREFIMESPNVTWSQIGGQEEVKQKLKEAIEWPLTHPETFVKLGVTPPKGILLYGPPGCSKTLTAKAIATETGFNFIAVKGPELLQKYVGESERAVRQIFHKARQASPSVIFFDEIDALTTERGGHDNSNDRVVAALLNEMDGIESLKNVLVLAATNRPDVIDPALMRPGRLDRLLYVGPPDAEARLAILRIQAKRMTFASDVRLEELAQLTDGCSGAEVVAMCQDAGLIAMHENVEAQQVSQAHFEAALKNLRRGITSEMIEFYESFKNQTTA